MTKVLPTEKGYGLAVAQALFVTFLWSTSWVLIKWGLAEIPALTFAGLRYTLAFLLLLPWLLRRGDSRASIRRLTRRQISSLVLFGLIGYTITQGSQFIALGLLPAVTLSLLLSFTPIAVALLSGLTLGEPLRRAQWLGLFIFLIGALVYFGLSVPAGMGVGLAVGLLMLVTNVYWSIAGRAINRSGEIPVLLVTAVSMGVGSVALLAVGVAVQGLPPLSGRAWLIIGWLAAVNTAFAFTLWNQTLRTLPAVVSSVINNTMLIQVAILAWLFLGERPGPRELVGLALAAVGALVVQTRKG
jgi:drug/metabolite transporter (DMT)-like permease